MQNKCPIGRSPKPLSWLLTWVILAMLCCVTAGCITEREFNLYPGDRLSDDKVCTLIIRGNDLAVANVDGTPVSSSRPRIRLLPGPHQVLVWQYQDSYRLSRNLNFNAEAGRTNAIVEGGFMEQVTMPGGGYWVWPSVSMIEIH